MPKTKIPILGVQIDKITTDEVLNKVRGYLNSFEKHYLVTTNPEFLMAAQTDREFREILNRADLSIPDGVGLLWAAKFLSLNRSRWYLVKHLRYLWQIVYSGASLVFYPKYCRSILPERVSGTDLVIKIARLCNQETRSIFLLGAAEGVAAVAAKKLEANFPDLEIAGTLAGNPDPVNDQEMCDIINRAQPQMLFVAYGHPKQEKWIVRNLDNLETVKLAIGVGGAYDFISGKIKRAPWVLRKLGLEWLWRLVRQPGRFKRILTATWRFIWVMYRVKLRNKT